MSMTSTLSHADLLDEIGDRFVNEFGESENVDFVQRLQGTAEGLRRLAGVALKRPGVIVCRSSMPTWCFLEWIAARLSKVLGLGENDRHVQGLRRLVKDLKDLI